MIYKLWEISNDNMLESKTDLTFHKNLKINQSCNFVIMMGVFWVWFNLFVNKLGSVSPCKGRKLIDSGLWINYSQRCQNTAYIWLLLQKSRFVIYFCCFYYGYRAYMTGNWTFWPVQICCLVVYFQQK